MEKVLLTMGQWACAPKAAHLSKKGQAALQSMFGSSKKWMWKPLLRATRPLQPMGAMEDHSRKRPAWLEVAAKSTYWSSFALLAGGRGAQCLGHLQPLRTLFIEGQVDGDLGVEIHNSIYPCLRFTGTATLKKQQPKHYTLASRSPHPGLLQHAHV